MGKKKKQIPDGQHIQQRAIKVRIHPTPEQEMLFQKTFGCCRFYWNQALSDEQEFYTATDAHFIPAPAKYKTQFPFLKEVDSLALANAQLNLNKAFKKFFDKSDRAKYPNFKSKKRCRKAYTTNCQYNNGKATIYATGDGIRLPIVGFVKGTMYRKPPEHWVLKNATVSQSASGKYFCSLCYEFEEDIPKTIEPTIEMAIGLDYSSPHFYADDDNNSPDVPHAFRRSEDKLAKLQRQLSRMHPRSKNYERQKYRIAVLHEKITNQRKDFTHKESRRIANAYDVVCVEDIDLRGLSGSLNFGKATMDNGFGMFRTMLQYKLAEQGKHYVVIDKWYPSSKTCSACGIVNADVVLGIGEWICPHCGTHHWRDQNGAINIKREGFATLMKQLQPNAV